jgi:DNA polymerase-3 subunit gamma/tau
LPKQGLSTIEKLKQEIARKKQEAEKNQTEEVKVTVSTPALLTPVTQQSFETVWRDYLMLLQEEKKMSLYAILNNAQWSLLDDKTVELTLASQHESEMFDEERIHAIPFFRSNLKNTSFDVAIKVVSTIIYKRAFTAEEKFNAMAEKNPVLNDLRKLLALDLE